jgi:serine/threonine-protein kinase RsbW
MDILPSEQELKIKFSTQASFTRKIFDIIEKLLDIVVMNKEKRREFIIALGEALDNAIVHGNKMSKDKFVEVECTVSPSQITCLVKDEGDGFDYRLITSRPLDEFKPQNLIKQAVKGKVGGLGIALMRKCTDEVRYSNKGNQVSLTKYLKT